MPDIIQLLPDNIANQIAAGEVIQRPASVVKELMENAVDAGATEIKLVIKDAGKVLIQVVDNGCGMTETDARMSFERHATSKISKVEDIFAIRTLGFRGEALASISAVANVTLRTKTADNDIGIEVMVEGSEVKHQEPCACSDGTSVAVKNLFYNVPARRNFLKADSVETRHLIIEFQRVALAHPGIFFSMHNNDHQVYHLPKCNLKQRIIGVMGKLYQTRIVPVEESTDIISIQGFAGKPEFAKKTRGEQFFFVNDRFIRDPYLHHAVMNAYEELLPEKTYPLYLLYFELKPSFIDINVHPTKQEIKFQDERTIYAIIRATVRKALAQFSLTPSIDFDQEHGLSKILQGMPQNQDGSPVVEARHSDQATVGNPVDQQVSSWKKEQKGAQGDWKKMYEGLTQIELEKELESHDKEHSEGHVPSEALLYDSSNPYQIHNKFIICQTAEGIIIIDQESAHVRVLFDQYLPMLEKGQQLVQKKLFPQTAELSTADTELLNAILPEIKALGFDLEESGKNTFVVNGVPAMLADLDMQQILETFIEQFKNNQATLKVNKKANLALSLARMAAVKEGQKLNKEEMTALVEDLFSSSIPSSSPTGKPTLIAMSLESLTKHFDH